MKTTQKTPIHTTVRSSHSNSCLALLDLLSALHKCRLKATFHHLRSWSRVRHARSLLFGRLIARIGQSKIHNHLGYAFSLLSSLYAAQISRERQSFQNKCHKIHKIGIKAIESVLIRRLIRNYADSIKNICRFSSKRAEKCSRFLAIFKSFVSRSMLTRKIAGFDMIQAASIAYHRRETAITGLLRVLKAAVRPHFRLFLACLAHNSPSEPSESQLAQHRQSELDEWRFKFQALEQAQESRRFSFQLLKQSIYELQQQISNRRRQNQKRMSSFELWDRIQANLGYQLEIRSTMSGSELIEALQTPLSPPQINREALQTENRVLKDLLGEYQKFYQEVVLPQSSESPSLPYEVLLGQVRFRVDALLILAEDEKCENEVTKLLEEAHKFGIC